MINNVNYPQDTKIVFDSDGNMKKALLGGDAEFHKKVVLPENSNIIFNLQGKVAKATIGDMVFLYEKTHPIGATLYFDSEMNVVKTEEQ
jgi:hypothetical protein